MYSKNQYFTYWFQKKGEVIRVSTSKTNKHITTISVGSTRGGLKEGGCKECQASCQSACKTSCTVGNQVCVEKSK